MRNMQSPSPQDAVYVFGGEHEPRTPLPNDVYVYSIPEARWVTARNRARHHKGFIASDQTMI